MTQITLSDQFFFLTKISQLFDDIEVIFRSCYVIFVHHLRPYLFDHITEQIIFILVIIIQADISERDVLHFKK